MFCLRLTAGLHGYSHMTGGWEGGQAEYARVVFADENLLKVPDEGPDEKYLLLSVSQHGSQLTGMSSVCLQTLLCKQRLHCASVLITDLQWREDGSSTEHSAGQVGA